MSITHNFKRIHALTEHVPAEDLAHNILYKALIPPQIVFPSLFKEAPVVGGVGDDTGLVHMRSACLASALGPKMNSSCCCPEQVLHPALAAV